MIRLVSLGALASFILSSTALAGGVNFASGTTPIQWKVPNVKYYVNPAGSADINDGSDLEAVNESYSDWCDLPCSTINANYDGTAGNQNMLTNGQSNGKSEVTWVEDNSWKFGSGVLGVTSPLFFNNGTITEADIALNGLHHTWTTSTPFNKVDTKSIVLHEVGHWYGIQHYLPTDWAPADQPTMTPSWSGSTNARTLEAEDIVPFCYLYGDKGCSSNGDCPYVVADSNNGNEFIAGQYTCNGGTCVYGGGGTSGGGTSGGGEGGPNSCVGVCGGQAQQCFCDSQCQQYNDCCPDYIDVCVNGGSGGGEETGGGETGGGGGVGNCPDGLTFEGCCDNGTLTWCNNGQVETLDCQGTGCGWDAGNNYYNCQQPANPDPSGNFPLSCGGSGETGGGQTGGGEETGGGQTGGEEGATVDVCEDGITDKGCCDGVKLVYCFEGELNTISCSQSCGWDAGNDYYNCQQPPTPDPSGTYPLICPGGAPQETGGGTEGGEAGAESTGGETPGEESPTESTGGEGVETTDGGESPVEESGGENPTPEGGSAATELPGEEGGSEIPSGETTGGDIEVGSSEGGETFGEEQQSGGIFPGAQLSVPVLGTTTEENQGGCSSAGSPLHTGWAFLLLFTAVAGIRRVARARVKSHTD